MAFRPVRQEDHPQAINFNQTRDNEPSFHSEHTLKHERHSLRERRKDAATRESYIQNSNYDVKIGLINNSDKNVN